MARATITSDNTFTEPIQVKYDEYFDLSITGSFVATVTVQRRRVGEDAWRDVKQYIEADLPIEKTSNRIRHDWEFRVGVKSGDYTSGTIEVEII